MMSVWVGVRRLACGLAALGAIVSPLADMAARAGDTSATAAMAPAAPADEAAYRLGAGDRVRVGVLNEDVMAGEYEVDGSGTLSLPLIGAVRAAGMTLPQVIAAIGDRLRQGYLNNPSVAVEVLNYRPFYVLGEVKQPGKYPYVSRLTVLSAIALAGGYTYRGKKSYALVIRASDPTQTEQPIRPNDLIAPGDIVRVPERVF